MDMDTWLEKAAYAISEWNSWGNQEVEWIEPFLTGDDVPPGFLQFDKDCQSLLGFGCFDFGYGAELIESYLENPQEPFKTEKFLWVCSQKHAVTEA